MQRTVFNLEKLCKQDCIKKTWKITLGRGHVIGYVPHDVWQYYR